MTWKAKFGIPALAAALKGKTQTYDSIIVDGSNVVFQQYLGYANNPDWLYPGLYGFLMVISDLLYMFGSSALLVCCWDSGRDERRMEIYPEYKGNRKSNSKIDRDAIRQECRAAEDVCELLPVFSASNREIPTEGDDIILSVLEDTRAAYGGRHLIITEDMDMLQLLASDVDVFSPRRKIFSTEKNARLILGFPHARVLLYKALFGDTSDFIKGVPGIGKKTAKELVNRYGSFEEIREKADEFAKVPRIGKKVYTLLENEETFRRNVELVTLKRVPYTLACGGWNRDVMLAALKELHMEFVQTTLETAVGGSV